MKPFSFDAFVFHFPWEMLALLKRNNYNKEYNMNL